MVRGWQFRPVESRIYRMGRVSLTAGTAHYASPALFHSFLPSPSVIVRHSRPLTNPILADGRPFKGLCSPCLMVNAGRRFIVAVRPMEQPSDIRLHS